MPLWLAFLAAVLACWRLMHLFTREDGPFGLILALRRAAGDGLLGRALDCPHCLGLWIALPMAMWLASGPAEALLLWLGIAGGASLLERLTGGKGPPPIEPLAPGDGPWAAVARAGCG